MYDNDSNAILSKPMKNRLQSYIVKTQGYLHEYLSKRRFTPQVQMLDNECSENLKEHFRSRSISFQLLPPHLHQTNAAERAIATFKDHFISGLASANPSFLIHLLCCLLPEATKTLNLLRPLRVNSLLSTVVILNGEFNYDRTPLAPYGKKSLSTKLCPSDELGNSTALIGGT